MVFFFWESIFYIKVDQRVAQFENGIYVPASHLPCGVNKGEISSLFLFTTYRWERWPWGQVNWPSISPAITLGKTGPAPHLGTPVELSLLVIMQVSTHWAHKCRRSSHSHLSCSVIRVEMPSPYLSLLAVYSTQESEPCTSPGYHSSADPAGGGAGEPVLRSWEGENWPCTPCLPCGG